MVIPTSTKNRGMKDRPFGFARLARDYAYVLPGFPLSLFAFGLLVPLTALSVGTLIIWIGALLLPLTLFLASLFAEFSRTRLRHWGVEVETPVYRAPGPGVLGVMRRMAEPRRWLDLLFETLIALPLRTFTFSVAIVWSAAVLAGLTYILWGVFLPRGEPNAAGMILEALTDGAVPDSVSHSFLLEAAFNLVVGLVFLVTLPFVLRGLALLDAAVTRGALGAFPDELLTGRQARAVRGHQDPPARVVAAAGHAGAAEHGPNRLPAADRTVSAEGWAWIASAFTGVVLFVVAWPVLGAVYGLLAAFAMLVALGHSVALCLSVRWPYLAIALTTFSGIVSTLLAAHASGLPWPWPVTGMLASTAVVLVVSLRGPWHRGLAAWFLPQSTVLLATTVLGLTAGALSNIIVAAAVSGAAGVIGVVIRKLIESRGALAAERRTSADLSAKRQELAERNRIAQELHDVVAHSMSVISVQATTAKYRLPEVDERSESEFSSIAESSRRALTEMRGLLTVLRASENDSPLAPQPTLTDVPALVETTRASGATITFRPGAENGQDPASVPTATGLTAYRIVQEALSNAVRHAPGAEVDVTVTVRTDGILIDVLSGPAAGDATGGGPEGSGAVPKAPGAGLGLQGIRERAEALGGGVEAGPTAGGAFRVHAWLPLG